MNIFIISLLLFSGVLLWVFGPTMNFFTDYTFLNEKRRVQAAFILIFATLAVPLEAAIGAILFPSVAKLLIGIGLISILLFILIAGYLPLGIAYAPGMTWLEYDDMFRRIKSFLDGIPAEEDPFCWPLLTMTYKRKYISGKFRKLVAYNEFAMELRNGKKLDQIDFGDIRPSFMKFATFHAQYLEDYFENNYA